MDWAGLVIAGVAGLAFAVGAVELASRITRRKLGWRCPWCGEKLEGLIDYIDHKDQHLRDEIEKLKRR